MENMQIFEGIAVEPNVRFGKPVVKGTRVPVDIIIGKIAGGMDIEEIMAEYDLTLNQVRAALRYAAYLVAEEELSLA